MATSLGTIITAVRQRSNMEQNQFVTDAEITTMVNQSLCQLDMILISKFNDYKLTSTILTASSTDGSITLPSDFLKLRGVDVQYSASDPDGYIEIREHSFQHRNRKPYLAAPMVGGFGPNTVSYRLQGSKIIISPASLATQWSYRIWYTPDYIQLASSIDTLQAYMDSQCWYEYAVIDCCIKILAKQDLDASTFMQQKEESKGLIMQLSAPNRNAGEPKAVVDTRFSGGTWGYGWDW